MTIRIAAFASGGGTNVQALIDYFQDGPGAGAGEVVAVISDREGAGALDRARRAGAAARLVPVAGRAETEVAAELLDVLEAEDVHIVTLAGYLRLVPAAVVRRFSRRMLNIHPALLPAFGGRGMYGLRVHRAVVERGCRVTGATVHYVDEAYDEGAILCQWPVPVLPGDSPETLAARVLRTEHRLYPPAVELVARSLAAGAPRGPDPVTPTADALTFRLVPGDAPSLEAVRSVLGLNDGERG